MANAKNSLTEVKNQTKTFVNLLQLFDDVFVLGVSAAALSVSHTLKTVSLAGVHRLLLAPEVSARVEVGETVGDELVNAGASLRLTL